MVLNTLPNAGVFSKTALVIRPENRLQRSPVTARRQKIHVQKEKNL